jgi:hypothetical protein
MIIRSGMPPFIHGVPLIGALGFAIAAVLALWLLISMIGNKKL